MKSGEIIEWNDSRGYGFAKVGNDRVFIHYSALQIKGLPTLNIGDKIKMDLHETKLGFQGFNVVKEENESKSSK